MVSMELLNSIGQNCPGFARDDSLYESLSESVLNNTEESCAICKNWNVEKNYCRIDLYDQVKKKIGK